MILKNVILMPREIHDLNERTRLLTYSWFDVKFFYVVWRKIPSIFKRCNCDIDILWNVCPRGNFYYDGITKSYFRYSNGL